MSRATSGSESERRPLLRSVPTDVEAGRDEDADPRPSSHDAEADDQPPPVTWGSMPNKAQLTMIVLARLAEPLASRALSSYLFYQLRWFDPALPDSQIAYRAGLFTASFSAAQCVTGMMWGTLADHPSFGRKKVLLVGLSGTCIAALGIGFSTSFRAAVAFRLLQGALNGNIGVLRTMVSEIVVDKRYRSRAFLLLPICFNVGNIIGPLLGGFLAEPVTSLPDIFGPGSTLGGKDGVKWLADFPYALPNLVCAFFLGMAAVGVILGLDETHPALRDRNDRGRRLGNLIFSKISRTKTPADTTLPNVTNEDQDEQERLIATPSPGEAPPQDEQPKEKPSMRELLRSNVILTFIQIFVQVLHVSAFNYLLFTLLPVSRADNSHNQAPISFTGGLGLSARELGMANTVIGLVGIPLQILLFPWLTARVSIKRTYVLFLPLSALAYLALPYLVLLPEENKALLWTCLATVLGSHVLARVFIGPATVMLVNECAPDPALLGTVHGLASSIASAARMTGPTVAGLVLAWALDAQVVATPFWGVAVLVAINWLVLWWIKDVRMT